MKLPIYHIRNLMRIREKGNQRFELHVPELDIYPGELLAVVGASGCGKSTFLDMLGLVLSPTRAQSFTMNVGRAIDLISAKESLLADVRRKYVGYVLQTGGLLPFLTVQKNIELGCRLNQQPVSFKKTSAIAMKLGIADQMKKKPQFLSGGQRQRVAIARALAHEPVIILADEPTAAVDRCTAIQILNIFRNLVLDAGVTLVMVSHDMTLISEYAEKTLTIQVNRLSSDLVSSYVEVLGIGGKSNSC